MFGLMFNFPTQADLKAHAARHGRGWRRASLEQVRICRAKEHKLERIAKAEPWSANMPWKRELNLKADTFPVLRFFNGKTTESPSGLWLYEEKLLPKGGALVTHQGSRPGSVIFDGPVIIPALFHKDDRGFTGWGAEPFMSLTPMEFFTLRAGTKLATGHVVIAGLGMGHQLIEVSKKKSVKKITVVEKSAELVRFIWPEIQKHLNMPVELIVGDAYEVLPSLTADIALIDIFPNYGGNKFEVRDLSPDKYMRRNGRRRLNYNFGWKPVPCPGIKRTWVWGAADVKGEW